MKVNTFYRSVLSLGNLIADKDGLVSAHVPGAGSLPYLVKDRRLVLPTPEHMAADKTHIIVFHPLSEALMDKNESPVMAALRGSINTAMNMKIGLLITELLTLATSPAMHARLNPDQLEIIGVLKDPDQKTVEHWSALIAAMPLGQTVKTFTHFYLRKNGVLNGKSYRKLCVTTFPLYEELAKGETNVYGVKLSKKSLNMFKALLECIFPNLGTPHYYSRGAHSEAAPSIDALLRGVSAVASHINTFIEAFENVLPDLSPLAYDTEWESALESFSIFDAELAMIPHQAGNSGDVDIATQQKRQAASPPLNNVSPTMPMPGPSGLPPQVPPSQADSNVVLNPDGTLNIQATRALQQQRQAQQGYQQPHYNPAMGGFGQPPLAYGYGYPQGGPMSGPDAARFNGQPAYESQGYGAMPQTYNNPGQPGFANRRFL